MDDVGRVLRMCDTPQSSVHRQPANMATIALHPPAYRKGSMWTVARTANCLPAPQRRSGLYLEPPWRWPQVWVEASVLLSQNQAWNLPRGRLASPNLTHFPLSYLVPF